MSSDARLPASCWQWLCSEPKLANHMYLGALGPLKENKCASRNGRIIIPLERVLRQRLLGVVVCHQDVRQSL